MKVKLEAYGELKEFTPEGSTTAKTYAYVYVVVNGIQIQLRPVDVTGSAIVKQAIANAKA